MPTGIERVLASLADLDNCELDFIRSSITSHLDNRKETATDQPCRLLDLAAELRNRIYGYVIVAHLKEEANLVKKPGLLDCNQQLRREFGDIYYGSQTMVLRLFKRASRSGNIIRPRKTTVVNRDLIKRLLDRKGVTGCTLYRSPPETRVFSPYTKVSDPGGMASYKDVRVGQLEETWLGKTTQFRFRRATLDLELLKEYGYEKAST